MKGSETLMALALVSNSDALVSRHGCAFAPRLTHRSGCGPSLALRIALAWRATLAPPVPAFAVLALILALVLRLVLALPILFALTVLFGPAVLALRSRLPFLRGAKSADGVWSSRPMMTRAPSDRLAKPVVTTRSETDRPLAITACVSFLLRHHDRLRGYGIVVANDIAEGSGRTALNRRGRHHHRLRQRLDLEAHIDELAGPQLKMFVGKFGLSFSVPVVGSTWLSMPFNVRCRPP